MLDLSGCFLSFEAKGLIKEVVGEAVPVYFGVGCLMGIEITCSSSEFPFEPERSE